MTKIEILGGRGSGKSTLAEIMRRAGMGMREVGETYAEPDRHVFSSSTPAVAVVQWLRANNFPARRKGTLVVVRLAATHSRRLTRQPE